MKAIKKPFASWSAAALRQRYTVVTFPKNVATVRENLGIEEVVWAIPKQHRGWVATWMPRVGSYITPGKCIVVRTK